MAAAGLITDDEHVELIGGELVPMAAKGIRHEKLAAALLRHWCRQSPVEIWVMPDAALRLSDDTFLEPDLVIVPRDAVRRARNASDAFLVVEIADSSLGFDLGFKAALYASFGVEELWVIDAAQMTTHVHRRPGRGGYQEVFVVPSSTRLVPAAVPPLAVSLDDVEMP